MRKHYVIDIETKMPEEVVDQFMQVLTGNIRRDFAKEDRTARIGLFVKKPKEEKK